GVPLDGTLRTSDELFHKVHVPANETLLYTLHSEPSENSVELFARLGTIPSRSGFDFLFSRPGEANQEIVVPNTNSGYVFDMVGGASIPVDTTPFRLTAEVVPFGIRTVSPTHVGDNGQVTITLAGARFLDGATVRLVGSGTVITAATIRVLDSATIKARFQF